MATGGRGPTRNRGRGTGGVDGATARRSASARPGRPTRAERPAPQDVNLRAQLPYFLIRVAALAVITVILVAVGLNLLMALLVGFAVAGLLTWPLGRMQRRAAQRAAQRPDARNAGNAGNSGNAG
ncbi:hypothetical protein [Frankia sp. BMG5.23]|uniref:hypothetical protein n=1 Tax=Frankia sp. BMG5.23 TaxID=683305 RepID=UPI000461B38D|nr:hypothetical protein [Frankia sp. BMG5.23]KDA44913.1 hypothetical protein BMG523Draft_00037 [Frankia sp. BMG5.23]